MKPRPTLLIISQVFVPDPASVGQHMHDAAAEMARRGNRVVVLTANRGYDDPSQKYRARETIDGIEIVRLPLSSFGKRNLLTRVVGQMSFLVQSIVRGVFTRGLAGMLISTSPPMCAIAAIIITTFRRVPVTYWLMDLNPDQVVEVGAMKADALPVRLLDALNRAILKRASRVVVLDRFMAERVLRKRPVEEKMTVMPPWPHSDQLVNIPHAENPFRDEYGLQGKFVVMYSGNHSPANPIETVLQAALRLSDDPDLVFLFVGGGKGKARVEQVIAEHDPPNIRSLPYQPLDQIKYSLSAADVHLVSIGDGVVGCVHPCKVYGAMALARPVLLLGPRPCHVTDLIDEGRFGWQVEHGDIDGAVETLAAIRGTPPEERAAMGARAQTMIEQRLGKSVLCPAFGELVAVRG